MERYQATSWAFSEPIACAMLNVVLLAVDLPSLPGVIPALQLLFQEGLAAEEAKEPGIEVPTSTVP